MRVFGFSCGREGPGIATVEGGPGPARVVAYGTLKDITIGPGLRHAVEVDLLEAVRVANVDAAAYIDWGNELVPEALSFWELAGTDARLALIVASRTLGVIPSPFLPDQVLKGIGLEAEPDEGERLVSELTEALKLQRPPSVPAAWALAVALVDLERRWSPQR